jgi:hypothetical protein
MAKAIETLSTEDQAIFLAAVTDAGGLAGDTGATDNAILRADGTGGSTAQNSAIVIDDVTTSTQANVAIKNVHSETNSALVLTPKGTGAFIVGPKPDGTSVGGNARGENSIDIQTKRTSNSRVASGENSIAIGNNLESSSNQNIAIGNNLVASGGTSIAIGAGTTSSSSSTIAMGAAAEASGSVAISIGHYTQASGIASVYLGASGRATQLGSIGIGNGAESTVRGKFAHASNKAFFSGGDTPEGGGKGQFVRFVPFIKTTNDTPTTLMADGGSTRMSIPSGKIFSFIAQVTGIKSDGSAVAKYIREGTIKNVGGTTSLVGSIITVGTDHEDSAGTDVAITADDTNDALQINVTGIDAETWRWVAVVQGVEIEYGS